ncbi:MAG: hypothetical protein AB8F95_15670 [Bacteroidia bacterium]
MVRSINFIGIPIAAFFAWLFGASIAPEVPNPDNETKQDSQVIWTFPFQSDDADSDEASILEADQTFLWRAFGG